MVEQRAVNSKVRGSSPRRTATGLFIVFIEDKCNEHRIRTLERNIMEIIHFISLYAVSFLLGIYCAKAGKNIWQLIRYELCVIILYLLIRLITNL